MIERVERFVTKGQTFDTLQKAIDYREGLVEEFLRKSPGFQDIRAKDRVAFVQSILNRRQELIGLLDFDSKAED